MLYGGELLAEAALEKHTNTIGLMTSETHKEHIQGPARNAGCARYKFSATEKA